SPPTFLLAGISWATLVTSCGITCFLRIQSPRLSRIAESASTMVRILAPG
ncbi:hypothetical protein PF005_g32862, partial [Phytophthora fragariae]